MSLRTPPFYENFDGTHCYQCSIRGMLEYFQPEKVWTWDEMDVLTGKRPNLYTWLFKSCADLPELGYEMVVITDLDIKAFAENPEQAIRDFYSPEGAADQIANTDLASEQADATRMLQKLGTVTIHHRSYTADDIRDLLAEGYLVMPQINPYKLYDKQGYAGHAILLYDIDGDDAIFHDSGPGTAQAGARRPLAKFVEAAIDNGKMEGLIALRPKQNS